MAGHQKDSHVKRSLLFSIPLLLLVFVGLLAAGAMSQSPVRAALQATETPTGESMGAATEMPAASPEALPSPTYVPDQNCIDCHSDAELLQQIAEEPEVVEAPNEGSG